MNKQNIFNYIEENKEEFINMSHKIWEYAELSLKEFKSANLFIEKLKEKGFEVTKGYSNIETAFSGKFISGTGKPVIGILGEFDALSGLSQKAGSVTKEELLINGSGHGCGHNMLGVGSFLAACAIKKYLEETKADGTIIFYGCPGEEGGAAKAFMAREGIFKELDCALTWHPGNANEIMTGTNNSCTQVLYKFKGIASHAAGNPEQGRSALDAVEIMNIGANYLREHMKDGCRIHYAMVDGGGLSPNVVQPHASVLYMTRSVLVKDVIELQKRLDDCAKGAAIMTGTTFERIFVDGTANVVPNTVLGKVLHNNMIEAPLPTYTEEELKFAKELDDTCIKSNEVIGIGAKFDKKIKEEVKALMEKSSEGLYDFVLPFYSGDHFEPGSTDVGDVSWLTPTASFNAVTFTKNSGGHSWQNVSSGGSSIGDKGMLYASKVLAGATIDLLNDESIIKKAKEEYITRLDGKTYICPIEADAIPYVIEG